MRQKDITLTGLLDATAFEIRQQDARWGEQNHPLIGGMARFARLSRADYAAQAQREKTRNDRRVSAGTMGWDSILLEEAFEALEAETVQAQVEELVQVAAVAINAARSILRNA